MRVLHCIASMEGGGAERQLCYLSKSLILKGSEVHVILLNKGVNYNRLEASGARIHMIDSATNYSPRIFFELRKKIKQIRPDVIHCWQRPMDTWGSLAALSKRIPFITAERTNPLIYSMSLKGILRLSICQFSAAVICNSNEGERFWKQRLIRTIPVSVLPNIVPFEEIDCLTKSNNNIPYIISVGRLSAEKNHETTIKAFARIAHQTKADLLILGKGPEKKKLLQLISDNGLERRVFLQGYHAEAWQLMKDALMFISLSYFEGMPNAVFEAAAMQLPMILSSIPAHLQYFDSCSAAMVQPDDFLEVSNQMLQFLAGENRDKTMKAKLIADQFAGSLIAEQHLLLYKKVS